MKFSKKDFQEKYKEKDIEEFYDPNKGMIGGDAVVTRNQVGTDTPVLPGDNSSNRKLNPNGPLTTNRKVKNTRNTSATFGVGGEGGRYTGQADPNRAGNSEVEVTVSDEEIGIELAKMRKGQNNEQVDESASEKMRKMIREMLPTRNDSKEFVKKPTNNVKPTNIGEIPINTGDIALDTMIQEIVELWEDLPDEVKNKGIKELNDRLNVKGF